jgi:hypothetical protein
MYMIYIVIEATIVSMQSYCNGQPTEQLILILLFRRFSGTDSEAQWPPIPLHLMAAIWDGKVGRQEPNKHEGSYVISRTRSQCHMQRTPTAVQTLRKTEGHKWGSEMCRIVSFCGRTHCAMGQRALEWKEKRARGGAAQLIWDLPSVCHYYLLHHLRHSSLTSHHTVTLSFTLYSRSLYRRG